MTRTKRQPCIYEVCSFTIDMQICLHSEVSVRKKLVKLGPMWFSSPASLGEEIKIKHHIAHTAPEGDTSK